MAKNLGTISHSVATVIFVLCCSLFLTTETLATALPRPSQLSLRSSPSDSTDRDSIPPWFAPQGTSSPLPSWWQRSWEAWQQWRHLPSQHSSQKKLKQIIVTPVLPDGTIASPASLWLPQDQIKHERGLHRVENQNDILEKEETSFSFNTRRSGGKFFNQDAPSTSSFDTTTTAAEAVPWYSYNSSDATPLVPSTLAWMSDATEMSFRAGNGSLDIDVARSLARLVATTYCNVSNLPNWNCTRCEAGFTPRRVIFDPLWDLQSFVGWSDTLNAIVIAFRGTNSHSYYNWVENMRTWRTDLALSYEGIPPHALVHGGFFYSYNSSYLAANITAAVKEIVFERMAHEKGADGGGQGGFWSENDLSNSGDYASGDYSTKERKRGRRRSLNEDGSLPSKKEDEANRKKMASGSAPTVFVAGHSLGGALATLAALDLRISLGLPDVRVVSFGSPRVGNYIFSKWFEEEIGPHWRFTHNRDIVPSVPPGYMGFHHVAQEVWVVDVLSRRTLVGVCDGSGEDPRCHNSVCHLGLCSSVADHLLYLSEMYSPHPYGC